MCYGSAAEREQWLRSLSKNALQAAPNVTSAIAAIVILAVSGIGVGEA